MTTGYHSRWWQCLEGKLLVGQLLLLLAFASWCGWIYYSSFYSYVAPAGENWRCATGESIVFLFTLLVTIYLFALCAWQFSLVWQRQRGKPASVWGIVSFTAALFPVMLLIYIF